MQLKKLTLTAMFAALCVIGGFIKIPSPIGSLALDTVPALLAVVVLSPALAGIAALIGHLASALVSGFPLGPFHLLIAVEMFVIVYLFAQLHRNGKSVLKWVFFVIANGVLALVPFIYLIAPAFFISMLPAVFIATAVNATIAVIVMPVLSRAFSRRAELQ